jgi:hypothetical protein
MSDRLTELQRQRALAQEQVAWFDREIARETGATTKQSGPVIPSITPPLTVGGVPSPCDTPIPDADDLLKQYQSSGTSIHSEVKRGCLIYFFAAFALLALGIATFAFLWRR